MNKKNILFVVIFTILGLIALQVPFTQLVGSKTHFTLYDFFAPVATSFIGIVPGIISVFLMQLINFFIHGAQIVDAGTVIRFFPMLFAAFYFGKKSYFNIGICVAAIIAFNLHPFGRGAWYYSLYWLIPIACHFLRDRFILARSFGATFTAHAVGGALWIYAFNLPTSVWASLVPITFVERSVFAIGIAVAYLVFNNVLNYLAEKKIVNLGFFVDKKNVISLRNF